jgi:hypothetical protein
MAASSSASPGSTSSGSLERNALPAYRVDRAALCRSGEPSGRVVRDAGAHAGLHGCGVGLLHALLGKIQIPRDAHRRGEYP